MAIAVATPNSIKLVTKFDDSYTDTLTTTHPFNPTSPTSAIVDLYTHLDALTESKIDRVNFIEENMITGLKAAAVNAIQNLVSAQIVLTFVGRTRNRRGQDVKFSVKLPSPRGDLLDANGDPVFTDPDMAALITNIGANFGYEVDNVQGTTEPIYAYGADLVPSECGFVTLPREINK